MQKKITGWKTKGMNRDLSVSAYNPEFAFENINLRLSTNEGNTMLSWVNERGPKELSVSIDEKPWIKYQIGDIVDGVTLTEDNELVGKPKYTTTSIEGTPIGTAVINHQLVLFTTENIQDEYNSPSHLRPPQSLDFDVTYTHYEDHGEPDNDVGNNHDTYTDLDTGETYTKTRGKWVKDTPVVTPDPGEPVVEPGGPIVNPDDPIVNPGTGGSGNDEPDIPETRTIDDRIYVLWFDGKNMLGKLIYAGILNFNTIYPLETLVSYESSNVQKVYWTDGLNQPRIINIKADDSKLRQWNLAVNNTIDTFFDFIPSIVTLGSTTVTVTKQSGDGTFAPGVIQYAFTYVNKYGQQSNAFYVSPLYYISHNDRGASPEDKVSCQFDISITTADTNFDYVRVYSIQRTSINMEPFVKFLEDLKITGDTLKYTDNGTTGSTVDPTEMLYVGGKEITAFTMTEKDHTLFMGNIVQRNTSVDAIQDWFDNHEQSISFTKDNAGTSNPVKILHLKSASGVYSYTNELDNNRREITTFKGGDRYRFGFQLQKATGEWLEPIFIDDKTNDKYPSTTINGNDVYLPYATATINLSSITGVDWSAFKSIRPVVVYPSIVDRNVLCQGVLNPTVFNALDRIDNSPFAQASWYFRPYTTDNESIEEGINLNGKISVKRTNSLGDSSAAGSYFEVYVLTAFIRRDKVDEVLTRGSLSVSYISDAVASPHHAPAVDNTEDPINENENSSDDSGSGSSESSESNTSGETSSTITPEQGYVEFDGAIYIGEFGVQQYAFFKTGSPWVEEDTVLMDGSGELINNGYYNYNDVEHLYVDDQGNNISTTVNLAPFSITSTILTTNNKHLYYYPNDDPTATYKFCFSAGNVNYEVTFTSATDASEQDGEDVSQGSKTVFKHYDRLKSLKDPIWEYSHGIPTAYNSPFKSAKKIEVQGSSILYGTVYDTTKADVNSNNQFFIDQSIVTLNSPDIDFDTEVQTYGTDNLRLRIVGTVPITANASAHSITASSMIPDGYNHKNGDSSLETKIFGKGELPTNVIWKNTFSNGGNPGRRLIAEDLWNDVKVFVASKDMCIDSENLCIADGIVNYRIYPWHKQGSLCNDTRTADKAASYLKRKVESNILYSANTTYLGTTNNYNFDFGTENTPLIPNFGVQMHLTENANVINIRLPKQYSTYSDINYYPNIDKLLYSDDSGEYERKYLSGNIFELYTILAEKGWGYETVRKEGDNYILLTNGEPITCVVPMKYKSTSHAVIALGNTDDKTIPILPYKTSGEVGKCDYLGTRSSYNTFWGDEVHIAQGSINVDHQYQYLWLGELYKPNKTDNEYFGGTTKEAIKANNWVVGGEAQTIPSSGEVELVWTEGDTYYQRYDCLKTYAYTPEDINQIVEILSFMCETHVNLDGRYDKNRGQIDNTNMSPQNFNLLNPVYTQQDNFFSYKKSDTDTNEDLKYPNYIYYSKTKQSGADVDLYTNVTLGSVLELDGNKGSINSLQRINDQIIAFQDTGISQILYNENAAISTTQGVPIELGNSGKVQGARYLSDTIGCSNKWSIASAPTGLYFIDSNSKGIFRFDGKLNNLSTSLGFNSWSKQNIHYTGGYWTPDSFDDFVTYYDKVNQDILFINKETALSYSEKFQMFQSFYDYNEAPYLVNLDDKSLWINTDTSGTYKLWEHNAGEYCNFFGTVKPFSMTLIGNPEPQMDKIFTNLEFRASVGDDGEYVDNTGKFTPTLPFDSLETWNEYQHGITNLKNLTGIDAVRHHIGNDSSLNRKFRMWRCDIPRDNAEVSDDEKKKGISRYKIHHMDRMRNPWLYLKLTKNAYYTDDEVTEHNSKIDGAVTVNTLVPESDSVEYYTKEQANTLNTSIEGAWQYNTQPKPIKKTEIHDLLMTYFS